MATSLEQLKAIGTTVVCDSGDFQVIDKYTPQDATTNPSLILTAAKNPVYAGLIESAVTYGKRQGTGLEAQTDAAFDQLLVLFGCEILKKIPGKVSTEVDASLSFNTIGSVEKALHLVKLYERMGVDKSRVLIKLASTWEGIKAAEILQNEHGVNCNLTLMFSLVQAIAAAEANAYLISPFVGRILDWHKARTGKDFSKEDDPGVASVRTIFDYYKKHGYKTIVMGASFRNVGEITELAGCDYLTIAPALLEQLNNSTAPVAPKLRAGDAQASDLEKQSYLHNEGDFRFQFNEDTMAVHKLSEGIAKFAADGSSLRGMLSEKIAK